MKNKIILLLLMVCGIAYAQKTKKLSPSLKLLPEGTAGYNGASVCWNPEQKKYYIFFAGSDTYPLEIFNADGKKISEKVYNTLLDVRGVWYNTGENKIQANCYNLGRRASYELSNDGLPVSTNDFFTPEELSQPTHQSCAAYLPGEGKLIFLSEIGEIQFYKMNAGKSYKTLSLKPDVKTIAKADGFMHAYNYTSPVYTGINKAEIGLMNIYNKQVELYNIKTGECTQILKLPDGVDVAEILNFAYSNGMFWVFEREKRTWTGYK